MGRDFLHEIQRGSAISVYKLHFLPVEEIQTRISIRKVPDAEIVLDRIPSPTKKYIVMKQIVCLLIAFCGTIQFLQAQELVQKKHIVFDTKILDARGHNYKGFIATIDDTAVYMSEKKFALTFENLDLTHLEKFGYGDISTISLRASGKVRRVCADRRHYRAFGGCTGRCVECTKYRTQKFL